MASVKVVWSASESLREQEFVTTGETPATTRDFRMILVELDSEFRQVIEAYLGVDRIGYAKIDMQQEALFNRGRKYGYLDRRSKYFDSQPTVEQVIEWIVNEVAERNEATAHLNKVAYQEKVEKAWKTDQYNLLLPDVETLIAAGDYDGLGMFSTTLGGWSPTGKESLESMIRAAREEIRGQQARDEKEAWVVEHGSEQLQRGVERGYDCQRLYVIERAAIEAPDFVADFNEDAQWKTRSCPSMEGLDLAEEADLLGLGSVEIVWLTRPAGNAVPSSEYDDYDYDWEEREAVVIRKYLGQYDLVREV